MNILQSLQLRLERRKLRSELAKVDMKLGVGRAIRMEDHVRDELESRKVELERLIQGVTDRLG